MRLSIIRLATTSMMLAAATASAFAQRAAGPRDEIDAFNTSLAAATRRMDNPATLALWDPDGVSLMPESAGFAADSVLLR